MHDRIEIRMFGRLFVRRADGTVVDADDWSTGKTADLLRLLALSSNRIVSVPSIVEKLWPDVSEDKARASLRTAVSRVRHVLDEPCIERHLGGLVLRNAWSDVTAFQSVVHDVHAALHLGDHARVVAPPARPRPFTSPTSGRTTTRASGRRRRATRWPSAGCRCWRTPASPR